MPPAAIVGGGLLVGGLVGGAISRSQAAGAEGRALQRQEATARAERQQAIDFAGPSPQELEALDTQLKRENQIMERQEQLLDAIDPGLREAGRQAFQLLKGDREAGSLKIINRQRSRGRAVLENQLRARFGSDFATSTAGQQALSEFDANTDATLQGAQQAAINSLLGTSIQSRQLAGTQQGRVLQSGLGRIGAFGDISRRRVTAALGTGTAGFAGSAERASALGSQAFGQTFGQIAGLGATALGGGFGGLSGGSAAASQTFAPPVGGTTLGSVTGTANPRLISGGVNPQEEPF